MSFPKVIIVGEAPLSDNLSGTGQTIFNLFAQYPAELIMSYVPEVKKNLFDKKEVADFLKIPFRNKVAVYNNQKIKPLKNRLGLKLNPIIDSLNIQWLQWTGGGRMLSFKPHLVIICPNEEEGMLQGYLLAKRLKIPFVIYLMDDWMNLSSRKWLGNDVHSLTYKVLKESVGWIMISNQLKQILAKRYKVEPKMLCVAHNPVSAADKPYLEKESETNMKQVVYAGSIWPMHYDSLLAVAQGIFLLRESGYEIELVIYSFEHFWEMHKQVFIPLGVRFGGRVAYTDLHSVLQKADLLLVTSTFDKQYESHALSSLQTKVTDYMVAGRAILACGPSNSACNLFVKEWECGISCETNQPESIKDLLLNLFASTKHLNTLGKRGYQVATENFSSEVICSRLYSFLEKCI